jgi:Predicted EndoIII-related endonuclease
MASQTTLPPPATEPFDIDRAMERVREAVAPYPPAVLFQLADEGQGSAFEIAVACIVSVRTLEEDTLAVSRRLFAAAPTPEAVAKLSEEELLALLEGSTFPEPKAKQIREIARRTVEGYGGALPCDEATLLALPGIGPKCAALVLGIACGKVPHVPVDIHVHRVTNRWGIVAAKTPEATMAALDRTLPEPYRLEINRRLVPFGKHVCTGTLPRCPECPLRSMCPKVGVTKARRTGKP